MNCHLWAKILHSRVKVFIMSVADIKRVVVVGGAGFIGSHLVKGLLNAGYEVKVIDNLSAGKREAVDERAQLLVLDILSFDELVEAMTGVDYVFHLAAVPHVQYSIEEPAKTNLINVQGTLNVLMAASQTKVKKLIYSASSAVYGDHEQLPLTEDLPPRPLSPYAAQKYIGEVYAHTWSQVYNLPTVSLRYFNVYGPGQSFEGAYASVISKFLRQRADSQALTVTGDGLQSRDFVSVHDVVRANILAMTSDMVGKGEVINIGSGRAQTVLEIARLIGGEIAYVPARLEPRTSLADIRLAEELLGFKAEVSLEAGLAELKQLLEL